MLLSGCSFYEVAKLDPKTNRFPTKDKATIIKSKKVNLDAQKALLLLLEDEFMQGQVKIFIILLRLLHLMNYKLQLYKII